MLSAKASQLLRDLDALGEDEPGVPCKAVVFSAQPATVAHLDVVLERGLRAGVSHASIRQGDTQQSLEEAVRRWKSSKGCAVLLLQASRAAAGLTLIAARHVFLMEPFLDRGQELQALVYRDRCHSALSHYAAAASRSADQIVCWILCRELTERASSTVVFTGDAFTAQVSLGKKRDAPPLVATLSTQSSDRYFLTTLGASRRLHLKLLPSSEKYSDSQCRC